MAKGFKFPGRDYKRVLTDTEIAQIELEIYQGVTEAVIREKFKITRVLYESVYKGVVFDANNKSTVSLGHKKTAYYTEKELLAGIPEYTFKDLSRHEKQFYLNYKL